MAMPGKISCLRIAPSVVVRFTDCCWDLCVYRSRVKFCNLVYIIVKVMNLPVTAVRCYSSGPGLTVF